MKVIQYHSNKGFRTGLLVSTGRKFHKVMLMGNPIRVTKLPISEERYFRYPEYKVAGRPYPVGRAKRLLKAAAKRFHGSIRNLSKEAREVLA